MAVYRYKNITDQPLVIMGVGEVPAGGVIETSQLVSNPNLKLLTEDERKVGVDPVTKPKKGNTAK